MGRKRIEQLRLRAEDAAGGPPTAEQVDALIDLVDALDDRLERAEKVIAEALNHDPLHGASAGLHCGGMAPCIRRILSGYEKGEGDE